MYVTIYPHDKETIEVVDVMNSIVNDYNQCTRYVDLVLGDGLLFNNLNKEFEKYVLNDYVSSRMNFYKLLKTQRTDYVLYECEDMWNKHDVDSLFRMYMNEKDMYKKCMEHYILKNKSADKENLLECFPKESIEKVSSKLKNNDILLKTDKLYKVVCDTNKDDLLFINLDAINENYHKKTILTSVYSSNAVIMIYSSIGSRYLSMLESFDVKERVNKTGYIFVYDNELPRSFYVLQDA